MLPRRISRIYFKRFETVLPDVFNKLLPKFIKKNSTPTDLGEYSISISASYDLQFDRRREYYSEIYWDTRYGFVLCYKSKPIANIGFELSWNGLEIKQIRGIAAKPV